LRICNYANSYINQKSTLIDTYTVQYNALLSHTSFELGFKKSAKSGLRCFHNGIRHFDATKSQTPLMIGVGVRRFDRMCALLQRFPPCQKVFFWKNAPYKVLILSQPYANCLDPDEKLQSIFLPKSFHLRTANRRHPMFFRSHLQCLYHFWSFPTFTNCSQSL